MKLTPELISKLIFASSQLRFFEKELVMEPSDELHDIVIKWQMKVDEVLCEMGADQYVPLKTLIETIKLNEYAG